MGKKKIFSGLGNLVFQNKIQHSWKDLILHKEKLAMLHEVVVRVRKESDKNLERSLDRSISALFTGMDKATKSIAVECIANDLNSDIYHIDLSKVQSKYIGETEKNLRRIFDAAEDGGAILFFDEADALFGKRSERGDEHDRYACQEIECFLQRLVTYGGLAILATNTKKVLPLFLVLRLQFVIDFPRRKRKGIGVRSQK